MKPGGRVGRTKEGEPEWLPAVGKTGLCKGMKEAEPDWLPATEHTGIQGCTLIKLGDADCIPAATWAKVREHSAEEEGTGRVTGEETVTAVGTATEAEVVAADREAEEDTGGSRGGTPK